MLHLPTAKANSNPRRKTPVQAAYAKFSNAYGSAMRAWSDESRHHRLINKAQHIAAGLIDLPAERPGDMLLKIAAAGVLVDREHDYHDLENWMPKLSGFICDDAAPKLLVSLRDDLRRMNGEL